jgi:hypothetical protein
MYVYWPKKGKLDFKWHGPYRVKEMWERSAVVAHVESPLDTFVVHVDRLILKNELPEDWKATEQEVWVTFAKEPSKKIPVKEWDSTDFAGDRGPCGGFGGDSGGGEGRVLGVISGESRGCGEKRKGKKEKWRKREVEREEKF